MHAHTHTRTSSNPLACTTTARSQCGGSDSASAPAHIASQRAQYDRVNSASSASFGDTRSHYEQSGYNSSDQRNSNCLLCVLTHPQRRGIAPAERTTRCATISTPHAPRSPILDYGCMARKKSVTRHVQLQGAPVHGYGRHSTHRSFMHTDPNDWGKHIQDPAVPPLPSHTLAGAAC